MTAIKTHLDSGWIRVLIYMAGLIMLAILFFGSVKGHLSNNDIHLDQEESEEIAVMKENVKNLDEKIEDLEKHITREFQTFKTFLKNN